MDKRLVKYSKFLSLILRHKPDTIGLVLDSGGWGDIDEIISKSKSIGFIISKKDICDIVENNNKKRFSISTDGKKIRAEQGHSISSVDIEYEETIPPEVLYHGTAASNLNFIYTDGIKKMSRNYVHMSSDISTAQNVGSRHSNNVIIFSIKAKEMYDSGYTFFKSKNGVWLTDNVPVEYIEIYSENME